jgi:hypothetical protein
LLVLVVDLGLLRKASLKVRAGSGGAARRGWMHGSLYGRCGAPGPAGLEPGIGGSDIAAGEGGFIGAAQAGILVLTALSCFCCWSIRTSQLMWASL